MDILFLVILLAIIAGVMKAYFKSSDRRSGPRPVEVQSEPRLVEGQGEDDSSDNSPLSDFVPGASD